MKTKQPGILRRFLAGLIDYFFILGITYSYIMYYGEPNDEGGYSVNGIKALVPVAVWFIFTVVTEQITGATIGNGIAGLKPLDMVSMQKPAISQSIKRHLLDPLDMSFFGLVAIIMIKNSQSNQRLGDLWGKTIVVKNK